MAAGALVGPGHDRISRLHLAAAATGIFVGDIGLYWVGRIFGKSIADKKLFKRFISERNLKNASLWLERRGMAAIFISRFVAGVAICQPILLRVLLKRIFSNLRFLFRGCRCNLDAFNCRLGGLRGEVYLTKLSSLERSVGLFFLFKLISNIVTWKRRRLFVGKLKRIRNWEFWSTQNILSSGRCLCVFVAGD